MSGRAPDKTTGNGTRAEFRDEVSSLMRITLAPTIWALHFAMSYAAAAIFCAKAPEGATTGTVLRLGFGALSVLAFALIALIAVQSWRQWQPRFGLLDGVQDGDASSPRDDPESRHRFLGHASFLLAMISAIGVTYVSMPVLLIGTCT